MKTIFFRILQAEDKAATLHAAIYEPGAVGRPAALRIGPGELRGSAAVAFCVLGE